MRKIYLAAFSIVFFICCSKEKAADRNKAFEHYRKSFIEALWINFPDYAAASGFHKYDNVLVVNDATTRAKQLAFIKSNLDSLGNYDEKSLNPGNFTDYKMMGNMLKSYAFGMEEMKSWEWNPAEYNVSGPFAEILNGSYDFLSVRLKNISLKLDEVPAYYAAAKQNIRNPTREHTELAISQNTGGLSVFEKDLPAMLEKSDLSAAEKDAMKAKTASAVNAIKDYVSWLQKLDNPTPRDFRLGKKLYDKKFEFDIQSAYTSSQVLEKAVAHKKELHEKMFVIADRLWSKYLGTAPKPSDKNQLIRQVIDKISLQHAKPELFQQAIEKQLPELLAFIKQKDLIYIDPSKPLEVRKEPDYMAGVAGASISAPGPYDKNAKTYYNVGSLSGWSAAESESYLREYNDYILQILNIHEAIPGHYTQLVYSNQSPSLIKSIAGNGAMVEGWAVYSELMMLENGYANSDEMWLMYYKWNLRSTCNTILDIGVHTKNLSKDDAMDLLINEAFQQQAEAEGKWRRVCLTQVQLCSYFTGFTEICELREAYKKQQGEKFRLKDFHSKLLSYGSAPVKYIRELMLEKQ
ncbi:DUF885 domain-containing protein [Flavobacterium pallidum]|uniref:DUF885 domain-containing protein n=1 Tax=Flavobacterium pallidum TaxID=2172098 RepID=A0A2S1SJC9_9FLAO|nr:DUF885 domain-containing protein [Flavobacterium pallidum]AWI26491.1 DUF885 domain-containing protein [Flavobacterium pallidum]